MSSYRAKNICCRWWCTVRWSSHRCGAPSSSSWATSSSPSPQLSTLSSTHTRSGSIYTIQYTVQQPPTCVWQFLRVYWMPCRSPPPQSFLFKVFTFMVLRRSRKHPLKPWHSSRIGCQNMNHSTWLWGDKSPLLINQYYLFIPAMLVTNRQKDYICLIR